MSRTMKYTLRLLVIMLMPLFTSCLFKNDMAYPRIFGEVVEFEVDGQLSVKIDKESRTVNVELAETADITALKLNKFVINSEARCREVVEGMTLDLSSPVECVLSTYQDYKWTISATQPIERYVKCDGIVGDLIIDENCRRITVPVSDKISLLNVSITALKFEAEGSVITYYEDAGPSGEIVRVPMPELPLVLNCNMWRYFIVEHRGQEYRWGVNLVHKEVGLAIDQANAWAKKVDVSGTLANPAPATLQYRVKNTEQWTDFADVKLEGNLFNATITGLEPSTDYEVKVLCGAEASAAVSFTTEAAQTLPNMGLDLWNQVGKIWYPNAPEVEKIWDSANPGSGNFGFLTTTPVDDVVAPGAGKQAAKLESVKAVIAFAAGNIFTGAFGKIDGIGAILDWGVPFASRPTSLKGYYKYSPKTIDHVKPPYENLKGQSDIARILVFITDWDKPFTVQTKKGIFVDFENDKHIIAYGQMEESSQVSEYKEFTIDLEYRDRTRKPKYIVIVATSSKYGDYFTGAVGSTLWVDELELIY